MKEGGVPNRYKNNDDVFRYLRNHHQISLLILSRFKELINFYPPEIIR